MNTKHSEKCRVCNHRKLVTCIAVAIIGYALAFAGATGALFAALLMLGVVGELGFWIELWRRFRGVSTATGQEPS